MPGITTNILSFGRKFGPGSRPPSRQPINFGALERESDAQYRTHLRWLTKPGLRNCPESFGEHKVHGQEGLRRYQLLMSPHRDTLPTTTPLRRRR